MRIIAGFVIRPVPRYQNSRFSATIDEALPWLQEKEWAESVDRVPAAPKSR